MNAPTDKGRMSRYVHQRNPTKVHSTTVEDKGTNSQSFVKFVLAHQSIGAKWIAFFRKWYEKCQKNFNAWGDKIDPNYWGFLLSEGTKIVTPSSDIRFFEKGTSNQQPKTKRKTANYQKKIWKQPKVLWACSSICVLGRGKRFCEQSPTALLAYMCGSTEQGLEGKSNINELEVPTNLIAQIIKVIEGSKYYPRNAKTAKTTQQIGAQKMRLRQFCW